jgi:hypothetical protein
MPNLIVTVTQPVGGWQDVTAIRQAVAAAMPGATLALDTSQLPVDDVGIAALAAKSAQALAQAQADAASKVAQDNANAAAAEQSRKDQIANAVDVAVKAEQVTAAAAAQIAAQAASDAQAAAVDAQAQATTDAVVQALTDTGIITDTQKASDAIAASTGRTPVLKVKV